MMYCLKPSTVMRPVSIPSLVQALRNNVIRPSNTAKPTLLSSSSQSYPCLKNASTLSSSLKSSKSVQQLQTTKKLVKNVIPSHSSKSNYTGVNNFFCLTQIKSFLHTNIANQTGTFLYKGQHYGYVVRLFHTQGSAMSNASKPGMQGSMHNAKNSAAEKNRSGMIYVVAIFVLMLGGAYAGVPLYKVFCQATGLGGQAFSTALDDAKIEAMEKSERQIRVRFNADVASSMRWNFKPQKTEVTVSPGETALAFYTAKNPTDKPIIGISTYNVLPYEAGQYFNKIQCFCFEEQRLNPKEQVDMPVFFFIDPEFADDPKLEATDIITLSYTFFEAVDGLTLPLPGYPQPHDPVVATS